MRLCIYAYTSTRYIVLGGALFGPHFTTRGVIAGCPFATTFTRVFTVDGFDTLNLRPSTVLYQYIDDSGISAVEARS